MFHSGSYEGRRNDVTNGFEDVGKCVVQRCYTRAEYECPKCLKRYCDEHYRVHGHFDYFSSKDLR